MEEILKQLLAGQNQLFTEIKTIQSDIGSLKSDVSSLKSAVSSLKSAVSSLKSEVTSIKEDISSLKSEVSSIKEEMVTQSDMAENTAILRVLEHRSHVQGAEMEGIKIASASHSAVKRIETVITVMNAKMVTKEELAECRLHLLEEMDASRSELTDKLISLENKVSEDLKSIFEIVGEHEVKLRTLSRRPV